MRSLSPAAERRFPASRRTALFAPPEKMPAPSPIPIHMLRHACGYELAKEKRYASDSVLSPMTIEISTPYTVRYTASNAARFVGLWEKNSLLEENFTRDKNDQSIDDKQ